MANVVYVIHQDLSLEAPHFLTRRRGAYVRTSEFSQTFEAQLASWKSYSFWQTAEFKRSIGDLSIPARAH